MLVATAQGCARRSKGSAGVEVRDRPSVARVDAGKDISTVPLSKLADALELVRRTTSDGRRADSCDC